MPYRDRNMTTKISLPQQGIMLTRSAFLVFTSHTCIPCRHTAKWADYAATFPFSMNSLHRCCCCKPTAYKSRNHVTLHRNWSSFASVISALQRLAHQQYRLLPVPCDIEFDYFFVFANHTVRKATTNVRTRSYLRSW